MTTKPLIGKSVKVKYAFPLDNEIFKITDEKENEIEVTGDFSAGTNNVSQSSWIKKSEIKEFIYLT